MGRHDYEAPSKPSLTREEVAEAVEAVGALQSRSRTLLGLVLISLALNGGLIAFIAYGMTRAARDRAAAASYVGPVVATQFTLVDPAGKVRGELAIDRAGQPTLTLSGNERGRIDLGFPGNPEDYPSLELFDYAGKSRIHAIVLKEGEQISLMHEKGQAININHTDDFGPILTIRSDQDQPSLQMGARKGSGAHIDVLDDGSRIVKSLAYPDEGERP